MFDFYEDLGPIGKGLIWAIGGIIASFISFVIKLPFGIIFYGAIIYGILLIIIGIVRFLSYINVKRIERKFEKMNNNK